MAAVIHKICVGAGGKRTLSPEEYACHYGGKDNKERVQQCLILKIESLELSDNDFKTA